MLRLHVALSCWCPYGHPGVMMTRTNDDGLAARRLFSTEGGVRFMRCVVSMVSVSYSLLPGWSFVTRLSSHCPSKHSLWIMGPSSGSWMHLRPAFNNSCPEWAFSACVNQKCGSKWPSVVSLGCVSGDCGFTPNTKSLHKVKYIMYKVNTRSKQASLYQGSNLQNYYWNSEKQQAKKLKKKLTIYTA